MIKMTPLEFRRYLNREKLSSITLYHTDQDWLDPYGVVPNFRATFQIIKMEFSPTQLMLIGNDVSVILHGIDYFQVDQPGERIYVHCHALLPDCNPMDRTYTFSTKAQ